MPDVALATSRLKLLLAGNRSVIAGALRSLLCDVATSLASLLMAPPSTYQCKVQGTCTDLSSSST